MPNALPKAPTPESRRRAPRGMLAAVGLAAGALLIPMKARADGAALASFTKDVQPILDEHCYDCHGDGAKKGGVQLDGFASDDSIRDHKLWLRVMKNVRAGIMPPASEPRVPSDEEKTLMTWIKLQAFSLDPAHPDPGRVTLRRLNRVEYRNTVRDLTGIDYDTLKEFPADDTGQGFDNIGDVLTISPMLLERYLDTAQTIIGEAVPTQPRVVDVQSLPGRQFTVMKASPVPVLAETAAFKRPAPAH